MVNRFHERQADGWPKIRTFNVIDDYNREGLGIDVCRGKPAAVRLDNGPEYIAKSLVDWANDKRITLLYIQLGKPTQNAYIESFNRTARHEWLDLHLFHSVSHAQELATEWLWKYNNERPNTGIGGIPPRRLVMAA